MGEYIAFDSHKRYTGVNRQDHSTGKETGHRLLHAPGIAAGRAARHRPGPDACAMAVARGHAIMPAARRRSVGGAHGSANAPYRARAAVSS